MRPLSGSLRRADATTSLRRSGTRWRLSIAQDYAKAHGLFEALGRKGAAAGAGEGIGAGQSTAPQARTIVGGSNRLRLAQ